MNKFVTHNWFKLIIAICLLLITGAIAWQVSSQIKNENFEKDRQCRKENTLYHYNIKSNKCEKLTLNVKLPNCNYELKNVQEFKGDYSANSHYIVYEGVVQNNSDKKHLLNAMIAKVHTTDNVLVTEGYTSMQEWIEPNEAIPFKIHTSIQSNKYYNGETELTSDVYPWFLTCK